jgi:hypothetical protein
MTVLPPLKPAPSAGLLFWQAQWDWHVDTQKKIYAGLQAILDSPSDPAALAAIQHALEQLAMTDQDLTTAVDTLTTNVQGLSDKLDALKAAADAEVAEVAHLIDLLSQGPQPDPAIADAVAKVTDANTKLEALSGAAETETAALEADDASAPA